MKIMLFSDSPYYESGMGRTVRNLGKHLSEKFQTAFIGWHQDKKTSIPLDSRDIPVFPAIKQSKEKYQGKEMSMVCQALHDFNPDILITLGDLWDFSYMPEIYEKTKLNWLPYFNVDARPFNPVFGRVVCTTPFLLTTSNFGKNTIQDFDNSLDVRTLYHGVDTDIFKIVDTDRRIFNKHGEVRKNLENDFVVFMDSQNTTRKNYPSAIRAFQKFAQNKNNVQLLVVSEPDYEVPNEPGGSYSITHLIDQYGLHRKAFVLAINPRAYQTLPDETMNCLYNISDVYLSTAKAEGFGLSFLQAMATNTIPVAPDYASHTELLSGRGYLADVAEYELCKSTSREFALVDTNSVAEKLEQIYRDWSNRKTEIKEYNKAGQEFVNQHTWAHAAAKLTEHISEFSRTRKTVFYPGENFFQPRLRRATAGAIKNLLPAQETIGMVVMGGLGDNIQAIPVVKGITRKHPNSKLVIVCEGNANVFNGLHPNFFCIEARGEAFVVILKTICKQFDYFYDIRYVSRCYEKQKDYAYRGRGPIEIYYKKWPWSNNVIWKEGKHVVDMRLETADLADYCSMDDMTYDRFREIQLPNKKYVVINNGADGIGQLKKAPEELLVKIVEKLKEKYMVLHVGTDGDDRIPGAIDLCGNTALEETAYVVRESEFVVCPEGGIYHLAKAVGKSAVVWLTVTNPEFFTYDDSIVLPHKTTPEYGCDPCWWKGNDYYHNRCMRGLKVCGNMPGEEEFARAIDAMS